ENANLPAESHLVSTDEAGRKEVRVRMPADRADAFSYKFDRLPGSLHYRIEAGEVASGSYRITAVEPVELAGGPTVTVTPPGYVNKEVLPEQTFQGFSDVSALQYSRVKLQFRFSRPAVVARLELAAGRNQGSGTRDQGPGAGDQRPGSRKQDLGKKAERSWALPVEVAEDRKQGHVELPALANGSYRLNLV